MILTKISIFKKLQNIEKKKTFFQFLKISKKKILKTNFPKILKLKIVSHFLKIRKKLLSWNNVPKKCFLIFGEKKFFV